jgi:hypothetical protein
MSYHFKKFSFLSFKSIRGPSAGHIQYGHIYHYCILDLESKVSETDSATRFSTSGFFHKSVSPKPLSLPLGSFQIFSKILGDITSSRQIEKIQSEKF